MGRSSKNIPENDVDVVHNVPGQGNLGSVGGEVGGAHRSGFLHTDTNVI